MLRARCLRLRVPERPEPGMLWRGRVRPGQDPVLRRADRHRYVLRRRSMRSRTKPAVRGVLLPHIDKSRQPSESSRPERSTRPGGARRRHHHRRRPEAASRSAQGPGIARRRHQFGSVPSSSRSSRIWRILGTRAGRRAATECPRRPSTGANRRSVCQGLPDLGGAVISIDAPWNVLPARRRRQRLGLPVRQCSL